VYLMVICGHGAAGGSNIRVSMETSCQ
jgi:hypothetical protein